MDIDQEELEAADVGRCAWRGLSLAEISKGCDSPQLPPVNPSENHTVLYRLPWTPGEVPQSHPRNARNARDAWDSDHVRMPCSPQSLYAVTNSEGKSSLRDRWELVREALSKPITTSHQLQQAILSYNSKYADRWDFSSLHKFFNEAMSEDESSLFFSSLLPDMIALATALPSLVTSPIPLLRRHVERSVSVSQRQAASLLANAFLCTFPRRNGGSEYAGFPDVNFSRLFGAGRRPAGRNLEKLKCVFNYFRRVCHTAPEGVITFTRRYVDRRNIVRWDRSEKSLPRLHVTSQGTIEDQGGGMLQVDFANSFVGGGVLGSGCVQEEIRFLICPELILSRLFTEELDSTEVLLVTGCERFSRQQGYADSFVWSGDHRDETPRDPSGRRCCAVVAMDAAYLRHPELQFSPRSVLRELNKAFVGFCNPDVPPGNRLSPVATGNWGCGAFRGKATLKALIQLMAASEAGRNVAYFTFRDDELRDQIYDMHSFLVEQGVTVGRLWRLLLRYHEDSYRDGRQTKELYAYLYQAVLGKEKQATNQGGHKRTDASDDRRSQPRESGQRALETEGLKRALDPEGLKRALDSEGLKRALDPEGLKRALESLVERDDQTTDETDERAEARPIASVAPSRLFEALDACERSGTHSGGGRTPPGGGRTPSKFLEAMERRQKDTASVGDSREPNPEPFGNVPGPSKPGGERSGTSTPKRRINDYFVAVPKSK